MEIPFKSGALVVTSIAAPNSVLKRLAEGALARGVRFIITGDSKSPKEFELSGAEFYSLTKQRTLPFAYARVCPEKSYTRKNIAYLLAIAGGASFIVETDDDNVPREEFWTPRDPVVTGNLIAEKGWVNAYHYFTDTGIYPRGFPIELVRHPSVILPARKETLQVHCPIQQGLADDNPDVDAIYRMLMPLPMQFRPDVPIILGLHRWCPFNSQNTTTFREAYPLLYLPAHCSIRMTDIWRSFVAQRILWTCDWNVSFHAATVFQERNEHNLLHDFADEIPGYLHNARIVETLDTLNLSPGPQKIPENLMICYEALIKLQVIAPEELHLLTKWLEDLQALKIP